MKHNFSVDEAREVAIAALGYIASHSDLLQRFLSLSGIEAADIRQAANQEGFWAAILQFLCANEPDLLAFCDDSHISPEKVSDALEALPGGYRTGYQEGNL